MLSFKFLGVAELFGLEGIASQVRTQVEVMRAQPQSSSQHDFVEDRSRGVDDQMATLCGADDAAEVASIDFGDGNDGFFAQEAAGPSGIAVAAQDHVAMAFQKLSKKGARRPCTQDEDSHAVSRLYHSHGSYRCAAPVGRIQNCTAGGRAVHWASKLRLCRPNGETSHGCRARRTEHRSPRVWVETPVPPALGKELRHTEICGFSVIARFHVRIGFFVFWMRLMSLHDKFGRQITDLRISVTDRCNFRCVYCRSADPENYRDHDEILSWAELERLARIFVGLGNSESAHHRWRAVGARGC